MRYRELLEGLSKLSEEQLDMDVTLYNEEIDEYFGNINFSPEVNTDVLDEHHPVVILKRDNLADFQSTHMDLY